VANGEVEVGFVNHYYLYQFLAEQGEGFGARNFFFDGQDPGGLVNVAGVAVLRTSENKEAAFDFIRFLLTEEAQEYFADETFEFPLAAGVETAVDLPPLDSLAQPDIDLSDLDDLRGTVALLEETGVLP
jgi:iron(III) transport system substrate-binding protein